MHATALSAALFFATAAVAADMPPDPQIFAPADVFKLEWADHPQLSPDGRRVVYERKRFDAMKDRRRSSLWLIDTDTGAQRALTSENGDQGGTAWSPDGKRIAYVSATEGKAQIHVLWLDSGASTAITHVQEGPGGLAWSPDGRWIAFTQHVPAQDKPLASEG